MCVSLLGSSNQVADAFVRRRLQSTWTSWSSACTAWRGSWTGLARIDGNGVRCLVSLCFGVNNGFFWRANSAFSLNSVEREEFNHMQGDSFALAYPPGTHGYSFSHISQGFLRPSPVRLGRRMRGGRRTRHREPNPGDWLCQCGETNYRSKRECFKCGAPAPPLPPGVRRPSLPGEDPHDWACACGQMNFRGSVVCHKCSQPKPVPPGQETTPLWTCPTCKGINREHRKTCFKCGAVSPNLAFNCYQEGNNSNGKPSS